MGSSRTTGLVKGMGLLDSTTLVMGSMIGSGIFIVSADIARQTQSPDLLIATWIVTAILTLTAPLSYGELAAAMPHAGFSIQTGTIAAVAVAFANIPASLSPGSRQQSLDRRRC